MSSEVAIMGNTATTGSTESMWRWRYAVPPEKGAWIWWIGPLLIGMAAGEGLRLPLLPLVAAAACAFLARQPLTTLVRIVWRGKNRADLAPAMKWAALYASITVLCTAILISAGHTWVLWMGALGGALFVWHLCLVARGEERHQLALDLAAAALLALTAPAAYWCADGQGLLSPLVLWGLTSLQSSASIIHMMLRLEQRRIKTPPKGYRPWKAGRLPLMHHAFNVLLGAGLYTWGLAPLLTPLAFGMLLIEAVENIARPPFGRTPKQLGMRQLYAGSIFVVLLMLAYRLR